MLFTVDINLLIFRKPYYQTLKVAPSVKFSRKAA